MNIETVIRKIGNFYHEAITAWKKLPPKTRFFLTTVTIGGTLGASVIACQSGGVPLNTSVGDGLVPCPPAAYTHEIENNLIPNPNEKCTETTARAEDFFNSLTVGQEFITDPPLCALGVDAIKIESLPQGTEVRPGALVRDLGGGWFGPVCPYDIDGDGDVTGDGQRDDILSLVPIDKGLFDPDTGLPDLDVIFSLVGFQAVGYDRTGQYFPTPTTTLSGDAQNYLATSAAESTQRADDMTGTWTADNPPTLTPTATTPATVDPNWLTTIAEPVNDPVPSNTPFPPAGGQP